MNIEAGVVSGGVKVLEPAGRNKNGKKMWLCECLVCGNKRELQEADLKLERYKSCGCRWRPIGEVIGQKHGGSQTRLYNAWRRMLFLATMPTERKRVPLFEPWKDFPTFRKWAYKAGYNPDFECRLRRINPRLGWFPENCRYEVREGLRASGKVDPKYFGRGAGDD